MSVRPGARSDGGAGVAREVLGLPVDLICICLIHIVYSSYWHINIIHTYIHTSNVVLTYKNSRGSRPLI